MEAEDLDKDEIVEEALRILKDGRDTRREFYGMAESIGLLSESSVSAARKIAEAYHGSCDEFDERVCSAESPDGTPMPANLRERASINTHARVALRYAVRAGAYHGLTEDQVIKAIQEYRP